MAAFAELPLSRALSWFKIPFPGKLWALEAPMLGTLKRSVYMLEDAKKQRKTSLAPNQTLPIKSKSQMPDPCH